jgi:class 3 adenylate cyclase/tetratricopeptide (TPR) repeat protein
VFCGHCGAENLEGRRFCTRCGTALDARCPACGAAVEPDTQFCGSCGTALAANLVPGSAVPTRTSSSGAERRVVSVLFADLVGFTNQSLGRDPEEVRNLLTRYFEIARDVIERYGGVVEKFIGDAVMAVWGTPLAREDDADRSVRAALELIDAVAALGRSTEMALAARAAAVTGEAAVTLGAPDQGMVAGEMVNTASRLQGVAQAGTVLVDSTTYFSTRNAIAFEEAGSFELKGIDVPVEAWRASRVIAGRGGFRPAESIEPPFTGREEEIRLVKDLLNATGREGKPRLASVIGMAGVGKSRLVWELYKYIDGVSDDIFWHVGRSPAYGEGVAFWALAEMVRMRAGIAETDDVQTSREKLGACLRETVPDAAEQRWLEPRLAHLLGLEERSDDQQESLFAAWRTFFERVADRGLTVLVFEDLHWADPGLIDFIEHVLAWARSSPIFVLTLARPDLIERRPHWGAGQRNFVSIHLEPLQPNDMQLLLKGVVADLPERVTEQIIGRAEGVPLYAVEMVRMLVDRNQLVPSGDGFVMADQISGEIADVNVPETLHSLIASRLDVLPLDDRLLVQDASVLGESFTVDALASLRSDPPAVVETRLRILAEREIFTIDTDPRSPERGQYRFVQSLIKEVAYQTLSKPDRSDRHLRAAAYFAQIEELDMVDVVATHYLEAYDNASHEDAETIADRARDTLVEAAERASSLGSNDQALSLLQKALGVTQEPAARPTLLHKAGVAALNSGQDEQAMELFNEALDLLGPDQSELSAQVRQSLGNACFFAGDLIKAQEVLETAEAEIQEPTQQIAAAYIFSGLARIHAFKGEAELASAYCDKAMQPAERNDALGLIAEVLITRGVNAVLAGRVREATALLAGAQQFAEDHELIAQQIRALINIAANQAEIHPSAALASSRRGLALARRYGFVDSQVFMLTNGIDAGVRLAEWEWCASALDDVLAQNLSETLMATLTPSRVVADAYTGSIDRPRDLLERYGSFMERSGQIDALPLLATARATLALVEGDYGAVFEQASRMDGLPLACSTDFYCLVAHAALATKEKTRMTYALQKLIDHTARSALVTARRATVKAGLEAIDGDRARAIELYRKVIEDWRGLQVPLDLALCQMDFALGIGSPEADHDAQEAIAFFERAGNDVLVTRLKREVAHA